MIEPLALIAAFAVVAGVVFLVVGLAAVLEAVWGTFEDWKRYRRS